MHIIHGTWIPDDAPDFQQSGGFYLWVETDQEPARAELHPLEHPRHLPEAALTAFLADKLDWRESTPGAMARACFDKYFLLPTVEQRPVPSFELLRYMEE